MKRTFVQREIYKGGMYCYHDFVWLTKKHTGFYLGDSFLKQYCFNNIIFHLCNFFSRFDKLTHQFFHDFFFLHIF